MKKKKIPHCHVSRARRWIERSYSTAIHICASTLRHGNEKQKPWYLSSYFSSIIRHWFCYSGRISAERVCFPASVCLSHAVIDLVSVPLLVWLMLWWSCSQSVNQWLIYYLLQPNVFTPSLVAQSLKVGLWVEPAQAQGKPSESSDSWVWSECSLKIYIHKMEKKN